VSEFKEFLKEYGIVGLALGVIIGGKAGDLVGAVVDNLLMPLIGLILPGGAWKDWAVGDFKFGLVLAALINFIVVAYFVFFVSKKLFKEDKVSKK
jgi:large conductance mechanosensitive channel